MYSTPYVAPAEDGDTQWRNGIVKLSSRGTTQEEEARDAEEKVV